MILSSYHSTRKINVASLIGQSKRSSVENAPGKYRRGMEHLAPSYQNVWCSLQAHKKAPPWAPPTARGGGGGGADLDMQETRLLCLIDLVLDAASRGVKADHVHALGGLVRYDAAVRHIVLQLVVEGGWLHPSAGGSQCSCCSTGSCPCRWMGRWWSGWGHPGRHRRGGWPGMTHPCTSTPSRACGAPRVHRLQKAFTVMSLL